MMVDENRFFREATLRITSSLEIGLALAGTFEHLKQFMPAEVISLHYFDPERDACFTMARYSARHGSAGHADEPVFRMDQETVDRLRGEGASVDAEHTTRIYNRPRPDAIYQGFAGFLADLGLSPFSCIMLRLDIEANYQGVLLVSARGHDAFTEEQARLIRIMEEPVAIAMSNARRYLEAVRLRDQLADDNRAMHRELEHISGDQVVGADFGLRRVMDLVRQVAPMNSPVLLMGDTGTGKEVIANAIHMASPRREGPLIRVQCGAIPDTLLDSELFGHEKGAFTGAIQAKRGRFERADGGTIFFDEIGELTLDAQVKLLRVLQEREFERLGGSQTISVDVRVIAATNRNLEEAVRERRFREDVWFRLNVFPIHLPPLRQRKEDIPALVQWLMARKCREMGLPEHPDLAPGAMEMLQAYDWPGNVRELQNIIERALILCRGGELAFPHLGTAASGIAVADPGSSPGDFPPLDHMVSEHIQRAMSLAGGRVQGDGGAAQLLGVNPSTLRARMRKLGVPFGGRVAP